MNQQEMAGYTAFSNTQPAETRQPGKGWGRRRTAREKFSTGAMLPDGDGWCHGLSKRWEICRKPLCERFDGACWGHLGMLWHSGWLLQAQSLLNFSGKQIQPLGTDLTTVNLWHIDHGESRDQ